MIVSDGIIYKIEQSERLQVDDPRVAGVGRVAETFTLERAPASAPKAFTDDRKREKAPREICRLSIRPEFQFKAIGKARKLPLGPPTPEDVSDKPGNQISKTAMV